MSKKVRLGLIGLGNQGNYYMNIFKTGRIQRGEVVAVCDNVPAKLGQYPDIKGYTSSAELIRSGEVDAVLITTPHYDHTTIGIDALTQGLHVLVEKPISVHKNDCQRLIAAHKDKSLVFAAMFNHRTDPRYIKMKQMLAAGELGRLQRIHWIITYWFRSERYYASGSWRATWAGEGGGVLLNQCPHQLDLCQWLFGMPSRVRAFCGLGKYHNIEVEDDVTAYLEYPDGATGVFTTTTGETPGTNRLEIAGDRGKIVFEGDKILFTRNEIPTSEWNRIDTTGFGTPPVWNIEVPAPGVATHHEGVLRNFLDAVLDGAPLIAPAAEGIRSVELGNAMLYSSIADKTVDVPLDGDAYEATLKKLIAGSTHKKTVIAAEPIDMTKTFKT